MKALLHYRASPMFQERLMQSRPDWLDVVVVDEDDQPALQKELKDTDVLLHVLAPADRTLMSFAPHLKLIQKIGIGVNTIDLVEAEARRIKVANMPGTNTQAVAELALGLMLSTLRNIPVLDRATRSGEGWTLPASVTDRQGEICGKTVGLVGYGAVSQRLAPVLRALGAAVKYFSVDAHTDPGATDSLDALLAQSDIVSLHLPLTPKTEHMVDASFLGGMKAGSLLINTARGGLVDEAALLGALQSGHLRGAGLDVLEQEPIKASNPLLTLDNVVVTPHLAWFTAETVQRSLDVAFENCKRLKEGEPLLFAV
ncbi:D-isomer specific 2-hydroxyacid dehydrogenase family protein [Paraburkholderia sp. BL25I1N1]|uniref:NAD(P)-dependent oxidoreductase n=1 Tax=Paraburkholderia sp. BL25I1N1 TaxID=1938804 RepID=UPI000D4D6AA2|nr:2-hydroxyacid dehydrogenase [Paraburkholderia sp. BL25I1N1]PRX96432.1 phosphoglycerate dehydrogenase-like enzyme [Paraburkholderia sp. BL25I1N1]